MQRRWLTKRRFERYQYALKVLAKPMDFTGSDTINLDRSKAPWPTSIDELDKLWDAKVKYDELSLKLTGKTEQEIRETLTKRYLPARNSRLAIAVSLKSLFMPESGLRFRTASVLRVRSLPYQKSAVHGRHLW